MYLTATQPYIISQTIVINKNNIKLIGRGPRAAKLVAKSGAVLTAPGHTEECLLLVQGATNVSIVELLINTINQANSSGNPRLGIGAWSSNSVTVNGVTCIENLGPNGFNQKPQLQPMHKRDRYKVRGRPVQDRDFHRRNKWFRINDVPSSGLCGTGAELSRTR